MFRIRVRSAAIAVVLGLVPYAHGLDFPGPDPGEAVGGIDSGFFVLENAVISCRWYEVDGRLHPDRVIDRLTGRAVELGSAELFRLTLADGDSIAASDLRMEGFPAVKALDAEPGASILARRFPGKQLLARLVAADGNLEVEWRAILRDGANAVRQELVLSARNQAIAVKDTLLIEAPGAGARVAGTAPGSPIVSGNIFFAYEHPDTRSWIEADSSAA